MFTKRDEAYSLAQEADYMRSQGADRLADYLTREARRLLAEYLTERKGA